MYPVIPTPPQCKKCGRHEFPSKIIRTDPVTNKKWYVYTCPKCGFESDLEPYKSIFNEFNPEED